MSPDRVLCDDTEVEDIRGRQCSVYHGDDDGHLSQERSISLFTGIPFLLLLISQPLKFQKDLPQTRVRSR